ncbi:MAG TPA: hypothetical protein ENG70_03570 [Candidatus Cloacimonetes bacterium]|nr:hypothetical protein [Candidatus Cloacimonadota bacterium]HEX37922.1 hypothetical protein [Candidatus Cloacimonadota bacterium]
MKTKKLIIIGVLAGLIMGVALFITGVIASQIVYGPQLAPEGKFEPEQLNVGYFFWTKLAIGIVFGVFFIFLYETLPLSKRIESICGGLKYAFMLWLVISLWNFSHPLVYDLDTINWQDKIFWLVYTLGGFLGYGLAIGFMFKRHAKKLISKTT